MILAVLEARCGVRMGGHDVYLNVAGGLRILEPAADLAVAAALVSSLSGSALPHDAVYFGEISLTGAVRAVPQAAARLKEAVKLGFTRAVVPESGQAEGVDGIALSSVAALDRLVAEIAARAPRTLRAAAGRGEDG
jgi:DNA repair protein RadA/Sms